MAFLVALAVFVAAILVGVVLFVTGHVVLGLCALLASLPFALASWVKWAIAGSDAIARPAPCVDPQRPRLPPTADCDELVCTG